MMNALPKVSMGKMARFLFLFLFLVACVLPGVAPSPAVQTPIQVASHILVSITEPVDGESYPVSAGLSVRGEAISDGSIARMELWADGELVETYTAPESDLGLLVHYWDWSPRTLGTHTLMVRAYNDQNQTAFSNVVHVKGVEDPGYFVIAIVEEGDTILSIAQRYNVTVEDILRDNPSLAGMTSLAAGTELRIHIGAPATASVPSAGAKILLSLNQWTANRGANPQDAPTPPTLAVTGQGCAATLSIQDAADDEMGFNVYRLDPGGMSFTKLTSLPAHEGSGTLSYQDSNLFGLYSYYVAAYDAEGESASNLVSLKITDVNCAGEPTTIDDLTSIPAGVEDYYLYLTVNNGDWRRFPAVDFTYLKKSQGLDFGAVAKALVPNYVGDISMKGEVWGVVNGGAVMLGVFEKSFKANQPPASFEPTLLSLYLKTKLEVRGQPIVDTKKYSWMDEKGTNFSVETFRFGTDTGAADGVWQVASAPFTGDASFNPACLLLTGKTKGSGTLDAPHTFEIDFAALKPKVETVSLSPFENMLDQKPVFFSPYSPEKLDAPGGQSAANPAWNGAMIDAGGVTLVNYDPCAQNFSAEGVTTYFVRVLPVTNGQPAGAPSNTVKITYDPNSGIKVSFTTPPVPNVTYYDVKILDFTGVHVPEWQYEYCVVVVKNNAPQGSPWSVYKPGTALCPETYKGEGGFSLEDLSDAIEEAFDFITGLYNDLSDWVTDLVEKLNPLCISANLASEAIGEGQKQVKDACHFVAVAVVTAAKTYAGLPPSLPNFDQLTEIGKDNLVELAAQELENNGIPCPEDCKNVIRKGIDYSLEQVKNSMSNSSCVGEEEAHSHGVEPLCLPPYITTKPDPRGQPAPAVVQVQVTRRPNTTGGDIPEPQSCNVSINVQAKNDSHVGTAGYSPHIGYNWQGVPIEGKLFTGGGAFPNLQPGESIVIPIILDPYPFWLEGHKSFAFKHGIALHYDDWGVLYQGALATITAGGSCSFTFPQGTGYSNIAVNGDSLQVGPLGKAWNNTCAPYDCP